MVNSAHWTKIFLTTHLGTGSIFVFTEKILWIISLILKISSLLPPGSFGGPDADLKLDIMKLNSHIILIKCIISVFSDTLKIYDKKSYLLAYMHINIFQKFIRFGSRTLPFGSLKSVLSFEMTFRPSARDHQILLNHQRQNFHLKKLLDQISWKHLENIQEQLRTLKTLLNIRTHLMRASWEHLKTSENIKNIHRTSQINWEPIW